MNLSIGKLRGLQQLADDNGFLTICAIDHRGALQRAMNKKNPEAVTYQDMVDFKLDLCRAVVTFASAVLLDPVYGAAQTIAAGILFPRQGMGITVNEEKELSREFLKVVFERYQMVKDPVVADYVNDIGQKIVAVFPHQPFSYHFYFSRGFPSSRAEAFSWRSWICSFLIRGATK